MQIGGAISRQSYGSQDPERRLLGVLNSVPPPVWFIFLLHQVLCGARVCSLLPVGARRQLRRVPKRARRAREEIASG